MEELATFSIPEVSKFCRICEQNIRKWYRSGILKPSTFSGSEPRFRMKNILEAYDKTLEKKMKDIEEKKGNIKINKPQKQKAKSAAELKIELKNKFIK